MSPLSAPCTSTEPCGHWSTVCSLYPTIYMTQQVYDGQKIVDSRSRVLHTYAETLQRAWRGGFAGPLTGMIRQAAIMATMCEPR